jgi:acyl-coenzyme A synthetase/AMP-(fatty) acid ligase
MSAQQRGELSLFIIDEVEPLSAAELLAAAGEFLDEAAAARSRRGSRKVVAAKPAKTPRGAAKPAKKPAKAAAKRAAKPTSKKVAVKKTAKKKATSRPTKKKGTAARGARRG